MVRRDVGSAGVRAAQLGLAFGLGFVVAHLRSPLFWTAGPRLDRMETRLDALMKGCDCPPTTRGTRPGERRAQVFHSRILPSSAPKRAA